MPNGIRLDQDYPQITASDALYQRAQGLIPAFSQTLAKGPGQYIRGVAPKYLDHGKGSHVWDVDGNEFIDYQMAIGPLSLGYCYDRVDAAIQAQLAKGITFSMMSPLEVEVAEMVREVVPNAESVRYSKTGCDVTTAAVRLARAYTGRDRVLCCGYHGWHDWYLSANLGDDKNLAGHLLPGLEPRGVPQGLRGTVLPFNYNRFDELEALVAKGDIGVIKM